MPHPSLAHGKLDEPEILFLASQPHKDDAKFGGVTLSYAWEPFRHLLQTITTLPAKDQCLFTHIPQLPNGPIFRTKTDGKKLGCHFVAGKYITEATLAAVKSTHRSIITHNPKIIVTIGDFALWALTGESSSSKWRGSTLVANLAGRTFKVIPILDASRFQQIPEWEFPTRNDLQRVVKELAIGRELVEPAYTYEPEPDFLRIRDYLRNILERADAASENGSEHYVAADIETANHSIITCLGLSDRTDHALCLRFFSFRTGHFFSPQEFAILYKLLWRVFNHPSRS